MSADQCQLLLGDVEHIVLDIPNGAEYTEVGRMNVCLESRNINNNVK